MTLRRPALVPPIVAPDAATSMPSKSLGTAAVPAAFVPMSFPSTRHDASMMNAVVPVSGDDVGGSRRGPADRRSRRVDINAVTGIGHAAVPAAFVPMSLPSTRQDASMSMPLLPFPEMTLADPGRRPADRRSRRVDNQCRNGIGHSGGARRIRADVVALDQARRVDVNAVAAVSGDDVGVAGGRPADRRSRRNRHQCRKAFATAAVPAAFVPMSLPSHQARRIDVNAVDARFRR